MTPQQVNKKGLPELFCAMKNSDGDTFIAVYKYRIVSSIIEVTICRKCYLTKNNVGENEVKDFSCTCISFIILSVAHV